MSDERASLLFFVSVCAAALAIFGLGIGIGLAAAPDAVRLECPSNLRLPEGLPT